MKTETKVLNFINTFKEMYPKQIEDMFLHGLCYWFATILEEQFNGRKVYDCIDGHFITEIDNELYDIRGKITDKYDKPVSNPYKEDGDLIYWDIYQEWEPLDSARVIKYCKDLKD